MTLRDFMVLPWTIEVEQRHDDGDYFAAHITELEGFVATGRTDEELDRDLWEGLEDFLRTHLENGDEIPLPEGVEEATAATVATIQPEEARSATPYGRETLREIHEPAYA